MAASDKIKSLLDIPEEREKTAAFPEEECTLRMEQVDFSYDESRQILKKVNMEVRPRSFVCLVGESGCGKSTAASLITGMNQSYLGHIRIGDVELKDISEKSMMEHITLVNHNAYLFRGTVRDNLKMAVPEATDEQMEQALKDANVYDFLLEEDGLDTMIAEQGQNLSGGQRQRIALARALLHDTPFYIFDEATSNIDMESEEMIMDTIHHLAGRKTVLMISHRLANAVQADRIYVMDQGCVVEAGTHEELMDRKGTYFRLYQSQQELENYHAQNRPDTEPEEEQGEEVSHIPEELLRSYRKGGKSL